MTPTNTLAARFVGTAACVGGVEFQATLSSSESGSFHKSLNIQRFVGFASMASSVHLTACRKANDDA